MVLMPNRSLEHPGTLLRKNNLVSLPRPWDFFFFFKFLCIILEVSQIWETLSRRYGTHGGWERVASLISRAPHEASVYTRQVY